MEPTTGVLAAELHPMVRIRSVRPGFHPAAWHARILMEVHRLRGLPLQFAWAKDHGADTAGETAGPVLAEEDLLRQQIPVSRHAGIEAARDRLMRRLRLLYRLPEGEHLRTDMMTVLGEPFGSLPVGTVVYQRTTTVGVVDFLLYRVVLDLRSGQVRLTDTPTALQPTGRPVATSVAVAGAAPAPAPAAAPAQAPASIERA
jgi:hypothetical protein